MPLIVYCTAALTSLSDSIRYITFLFSEWRIGCLAVCLKVKNVITYLCHEVFLPPLRLKVVEGGSNVYFS